MKARATDRVDELYQVGLRMGLGLDGARRWAERETERERAERRMARSVDSYMLPGVWTRVEA